MNTSPSQKQSCAWTLIDLLVVIAVTLLLIWLYLPRLAVSHRSPRIECVNNLKQIGLAFHQSALDHDGKFPMRVAVTNGVGTNLPGNICFGFQSLSNELNTPKLLHCPADQHRIASSSFASNFSNANISYFLGLAADETAPAMFLSGDDSFTVGGVRPKPGVLELWTNSQVAWTKDRHGGAGNVLLSDGSVQQATSPRLQELLQGAGKATNTLLLP